MRTRALRLQIQQGRLEGLVTLHVPAAAAAAYAAAPDLAVALAPAALDGLRLEADGVPVQPKVADASARRRPDGSLDASFLLEPLKAPSRLRVAVEAGLPLPAELIGETGLALSLLEGPGAPVKGGLALHPRPGVPCLVKISGAATGKPR